MRIDDVQTFVQVARMGSVAGAAFALGQTQPNISKALARLERATGVHLLERTTRGVYLTDEGEVFLKHAQKLGFVVNDLFQHMRDLRQSKTGTLRIGFGQAIADAWIVPIVTDLVNQGVQLEITGGYSSHIKECVLNGDVDVGLCGIVGEPEAGFNWHPLRADPLTVLAPRNLELGRNRICGWDDLSRASWVVLGVGNLPTSQFIQSFIRRKLSSPKILIAFRSSVNEIAMAEAVNALFMLPKSIAPELITSGRFYELVLPSDWALERSVGLLTRSQGYLSSAGQRFVDQTKSLFARLPASIPVSKLNLSA